ncbi:bifunctional 4-hydroxy-2-oxoglutarate aldolase/2-dehydro-3-deoxy-phosphogluconate aldolase [Novosphingobium sp. NPDC080210]|uniref:bifunctional 4-hydroxy-2-oxoglutarate aldolase/2-dehydro-3-deoxy-phosphogluconate aldolase n=1 Tax=unclassified Novosphingobium TaxID=2644732 RepID=UPI0035B01CA8
MSPVEKIMRTAPVIPVLTIEDVAHAAPIAEALVKGGLPVLEVTLRTSTALEVIREMKQVPGAIVGAGTVLNEHALEDALEAGSEFIVSPGFTESLAKAAIASGTAFLPGTATSSDIMRGLDLGLDRFKFFPAEANGGIPALKAIAAPFGMVKFCPTGGITAASAPNWLALDYVLCCGGSWIVPQGTPDLAAIEATARAAAGLGQ